MTASLYDNLAVGLATALSLSNLLLCLAGVTVGMLVGVIPGIGALAAISLLLPLTFHIDPAGALIMMAGIYYGTAYGGSTAAILLNLPGTPSSAVTCLDGFPMSKQGRAGIALLMTTVASFVGATIGILIMMAFSPAIVAVALQFGPAEYFSLMVLALIAASTIGSGSVLKAIAMVVLGAAFGVVGTDVYTGSSRFTFGVFELFDGVSLVALAIGLFGVAEVIAGIPEAYATKVDVKDITLRSMVPTRDDVRRSWLPMIRGSLIGSFFGALPGTGATVSSFMSYTVERKLAKDPSRFGKGAIEGVASPEASNNASDQTAFIPTLTLGIPGTPTMAIMIGVFMIHGVIPGPSLMNDHPDVFWGLVMSFWVGNFLLLILNIPLIGIWIRILAIPYHYMYLAVMMFVCVGTYSINQSVTDVWTVLLFGGLGYVFRLLDFPAAPLLLGFVLGPMMEENFRRAMLVSGGDFMTLIDRPISGAFLAVSGLLLLWGLSSVVGLRLFRLASKAEF